MNTITKENTALEYYAWLIRATARPQTFEEWLDWLFIYFSTGSEWVPPPSVSLSRTAAHQPGFIHLNSLTQWAWGLLPYWFWWITRDKPLLREAFMALQREHDAAECKTLNMIHGKPGSLFPIISSWRHATLFSDESSILKAEYQVVYRRRQSCKLLNMDMALTLTLFQYNH